MSHATYHHAPEELKGRVRGAIAGEVRARASRQVQRVFAWGAAFAAVAVVSWNLALVRPGSGEYLVERDVVSAHMRSVMPTGKLNDVLATDRHEVKPWFTGKLDFAPDVPDLSARGFVLAGGRIDYVDGRTVAAVTYRYRLHVVNVFEWPAKGVRTSTPQVTSRRGYNIVHWSREGIERWAISDLAVAELRTIAD